MRLHEFSATGWRNLAPLTLTPQPALNVIHGRNAQGKTNLLEALYYVAALRSFRTTRPRQLIAWGAEFLRLEAAVEAGGRHTRLAVALSSEGRRLRVDGATVDAVDAYFGGYNAVLFTPDHLRLVRGEPAARRQFLDRALFNVDPAQLACVRRYNRLLSERNATLKRYGDRPRDAATLLDVLDEQLCTAAAELVARRQALCEELAPRIQAFHARVAGPDKPVRIAYRCRGLSEAHALWETTGADLAPASPVEAGSAESEDADTDRSEDEEYVEDSVLPQDRYAELLGKALADRRADDLRRGFTSLGPHQDDLEVRLDGRAARATSSQGEARTLVLAMKLAEVEFVHDRRSESPVILLDDLGSELDEQRREILFQTLVEMRCQTFLTTVAPDLVPSSPDNVYFRIDHGTLSPG